MRRTGFPFLAALPLAALALSLAPASVRADDEESTVEWLESYAEAATTARDADSPLLFKFYSGWCPHCVRMDKTTWRDEKVGELAESFVAAKVNSDVEKVPVKRYSLTGYPTVIIAEPGGEQVLRLSGYKDARVIAAYLGAYLDNAEGIHEAFRRLREDRDDAAAQYELGEFYSRVGLHAEAAERFEKAVGSADPTLSAQAAARGALSLVEMDEAKAASKLLKRSAQSPPAAAAPVVLLARARTEAALGNTESARAALTMLLENHSDTSEAESGRALLESL